MRSFKAAPFLGETALDRKTLTESGTGADVTDGSHAAGIARIYEADTMPTSSR